MNLVSIEKVAATRTLYTFKNKNSKGETLVIELSLCKDNPTYKNSLPKLWYKKGYIDRVLETYWNIDTYVTDSEGSCWSLYNPQLKAAESGKSAVINFDWMLEATEENKQKIINEVYTLFSKATGKSATEKKIDKVKDFAIKNNLKVVTEIPEGWEKVAFPTDPIGCISICNEKMSLEAIRNKTFERRLLLI